MTRIAFERQELDRQMVERLIRDMRWRGLSLLLSYERAGPRWSLSNGKLIPAQIARAAITRPEIQGVGDSLFSNGPAQTYRYVEEADAS
jgi:hypothetical protein